MKLGAKGLGLLNYESRSVGGEGRFLRHHLRDLRSPVIFDVGANQGNWSAQVVRANPSAVIYAFEPHPETYKRLQQSHPAIRTFNCALGAKRDTLRLFDYPSRDGSSHASLVSGVIERVHRASSAGIDVAVTTVDDFCREKAIQTIDLLKIDTEGYELPVLQGAGKMLAEKRVRAIQFEFGEIHALTHTFLQELVDVLGPAFRVFRILPRGLLDLGQQSRWQQEQFAHQNLVALPRDERRDPSNAI